MSASNYLAVKLPRMMIDERGRATWAVDSRDAEARVVIRPSDGLVTLEGVANPFSTPEQAASAAAALLAAAEWLQRVEVAS